MAIVSSYTAHTGALLATGDKIYIADVSDGTSGSQSMTVAELLVGLPRLGFNPLTTGIMAVGGVTQWNWQDGAIYPETDDDVDLGKTAQRFKDLYIDGIAYLDDITLAGTAITATAAELNYVDVTTTGAVQASKAVVVDANKDALGFRDLSGRNLDLGASGTAGTLDIFPATATSGKMQIAPADNAGDTTTTITNASQAGARTYTIPDAGASASFAMTEGAQTINGVKTLTGANIHSGTFVQGSDATDRVVIKGHYMNPANLAVAVPTIADAETDSVAVDVSGAFSMAPAVGDAVIALPQEALPTDCILMGAYVTNTDEITLTFGAKEGGAGVTGANKNFKFLVLDLT